MIAKVKPTQGPAPRADALTSAYVASKRAQAAPPAGGALPPAGGVQSPQMRLPVPPRPIAPAPFAAPFSPLMSYAGGTPGIDARAGIYPAAPQPPQAPALAEIARRRAALSPLARGYGQRAY